MKIINIILPKKIRKKLIQVHDSRISQKEYFLQKHKIELIQIMSVSTLVASVEVNNSLKYSCS